MNASCVEQVQCCCLMGHCHWWSCCCPVGGHLLLCHWCRRTPPALPPSCKVDHLVLLRPLKLDCARTLSPKLICIGKPVPLSMCAGCSKSFLGIEPSPFLVSSLIPWWIAWRRHRVRLVVEWMEVASGLLLLGESGQWVGN